jgi:hypothetical protein
MESIQFFMVQRGLVMKIDRGMEWTGKISSLQVAKRNGWTAARTARQALRDINLIAPLVGREVMWSEKFGDESGLPTTVIVAAE